VESVLQSLVVIVLVAASAAFAAWRLSPARLKLRLLDRMKPDTANLWGRSLARLRSGVAAELMHGCSACASTPPPMPKHKIGPKAG
jgi:Family of unknown function (DUF6587)